MDFPELIEIIERQRDSIAVLQKAVDDYDAIVINNAKVFHDAGLEWEEYQLTKR